MEASREELQCNSKAEESTTTSRNINLSEESQIPHPTRISSLMGKITHPWLVTPRSRFGTANAAGKEIHEVLDTR
jgi:septal ring factor EnvC (AmiA/AmiB activator)